MSSIFRASPRPSGRSEDLASNGRWSAVDPRSRTRRSRRRRAAPASFRSRGAISRACRCARPDRRRRRRGRAQSDATSSYLTIGTEGDQVSALEDALGIPADGYFDEAAASAVRGYQSENGLASTGSWDPRRAARSVRVGGPARRRPVGVEHLGGGNGHSIRSPSASRAATPRPSQGRPVPRQVPVLPRDLERDRRHWRPRRRAGVAGRPAPQLFAQSGTSPWPNCG